MQNTDLTLLTHHHQLVNAVAMRSDIPRQVRNLLVGIATFFNVGNQSAYPSRRQIAERTGYCMNHVTDLIKQASDLNLIESKAQFKQVDGEVSPRQIANEYTFNLKAFGLFYSKAKALIAQSKRKRNKPAPPTPPAASSAPITDPVEPSQPFDLDSFKKELRRLKNAPPK